MLEPKTPQESEQGGEAVRALAGAMPRCPRCGWQDVRLSMSRRPLDIALAAFALSPFRCRSCHHRFYRFFKRFGDR